MFNNLKQKLQDNFKELSKNNLFYVDIDRDEIFQQYLNGFEEDTKQSHNCNCCKSFLRQYAGIVGIVIVLVGFANFAGYINIPTGGVAPQSVANANLNAQNNANSNALQNANACSALAATSNGISRANVVAKNAENSSGGYLQGTVSANSQGDLINSGGVLLDSATTTASGVTPTFVTMSTSIKNCAKGLLLGTVTTGTGFASSRQVKDIDSGNSVNGYDFTDAGVHSYELQTASSDVLSCEAADYSNAVASSWLGNGSVGTEVTKDANGHLFVSGTGTADGNFYFKNTSLVQNGNINGYIRCQVNNTASVFGAYNEPDAVVFSYDPGALARFDSNSLTLSSNTPGWSVTKGPCGSGSTNNRAAKACWTAPTIKAGVLYEMRFTLTANVGDPVGTDTMPRLYIDDKQIFRDSTLIARYGTFSTSGTNQGVGGTVMNFVLI